MAHSAATRGAVRRAYVSDRVPLTESARRAKIPLSTVRAWKRSDRAAGDCWDRAREAARLATGGLGSVTEQVLTDFSLLFTTTMADLKTDTTPPVERARAMAMLSDAYSKTMRAAGAADPRLGRLAIALEVLERLARHLQSRRPELLGVVLEELEAFGQTLSAEWG